MHLCLRHLHLHLQISVKQEQNGIFCFSCIFICVKLHSHLFSLLWRLLLRCVCVACLNTPLATSTAAATRNAQNNRFIQYLQVGMHQVSHLAPSSKNCNVKSKSFKAMFTLGASALVPGHRHQWCCVQTRGSQEIS